ncbi:Ig-like domain-containing protein [Candidatus Woesebacteria bacterium]|nr:Ig-like domain-containing protein [Candidatus Woesebacteria bacterium]
MQKIIVKTLQYFQKLSKITRITIIVAVILGLFSLGLSLLSPEQTPSVSSITPVTEFGISLNSNFTITFNQILDSSTKKKITFQVSPAFSTQEEWLENNYQYNITPSVLLKKNTQYTVTVFYKNKSIFSKQFLSSQFGLEEETEHIKEQSQADIEFNEAIENLEKDFFWYKDIPIDNSEYTVVYDYDRKEFRIRLKIPENSSPEVIQTITQKALLAMEDLGINPKDWGYYVLFLN